MDINGINKFLPIGSVVLLKGAKKRLMIMGHRIVAKENISKIYDYSGCLYPEGNINSELNILFDHENVEKIYLLGYSDEEEKEYRKNLLECNRQVESKSE